MMIFQKFLIYLEMIQMKKDNILMADRWKFGDFRKDNEYIYFIYNGKQYKRIFYYNSNYPYNYIFRFQNKKYRVQF